MIKIPECFLVFYQTSGAGILPGIKQMLFIINIKQEPDSMYVDVGQGNART